MTSRSALFREIDYNGRRGPGQGVSDGRPADPEAGSKEFARDRTESGMPDPAKAVVLLSGGLDSATALAEAKAAGFAVHALTIALWPAARRRAAPPRVGSPGPLGVARHVEQTIDLRAFGGSALTGDLEVPKDRPAEAMAAGIPITYVPARNTVFLALALAWAETPGRLRHLPRRELRRLLGLSRLPPRIPSRLRGAGQPGDRARASRGRAGSASMPPCSS